MYLALTAQEPHIELVSVTFGQFTYLKATVSYIDFIMCCLATLPHIIHLRVCVAYFPLILLSPDPITHLKRTKEQRLTWLQCYWEEKDLNNGVTFIL